MSVDDGQDDARQRLAAQLSRLRETADAGRPVTFRRLAERTHFGAATLNKATTGKEVPTWPVVEALVAECGGDPEGYRELWEQAKAQAQRADTTPSAAPDPSAPATTTTAPAAGGGPPTGRRRVPGWAGWAVAGLALVAVVALAAALLAFRTTTTSATVPSVAAPSAATPPAGGAGPAVSAAPVSVIPPAATTAQITSPAGSTIGFEFPVAGAVSSAPPAGVRLWEVTLDQTYNKFTPDPRPCVVLDADQFSCGATFAGTETMTPGSSSYRLLIVAADTDAVNAFLAYHELRKTPAGASVHGMTALPPGARIVGQKTVTRS